MILVGLSGGERSVAALTRLLDAGREVVVHHVHIAGCEHETERARAVVRELQERRSFAYAESALRWAPVAGVLPAVIGVLSPLAYAARRPYEHRGALPLVLGSDGGHGRWARSLWRALHADLERPSPLLVEERAAEAAWEVPAAPDGGVYLASLSGGADSAWAVRHMLEQGHRIVAHHLQLRTGATDARWRAELSAARGIVAALRGLGHELPYHESVVDLRPHDGALPPMAPTLADHVLAARDIVGLVRGNARHDWAGRLDDYRRRRAHRDAVWRALLGGRAVPIVDPAEDRGRAAMWRDMPEALRMSTISCRSPRAEDGRWVQCGTCTPCRQLVEAGVPLERAVPVLADAEP